jgi:hypothetical protein
VATVSADDAFAIAPALGWQLVVADLATFW